MKNFLDIQSLGLEYEGIKQELNYIVEQYF